MVFVPSRHVGAPVLPGSPLNSGEPASSSKDHPVSPGVLFFFPKGNLLVTERKYWKRMP